VASAKKGGRRPRATGRTRGGEGLETRGPSEAELTASERLLQQSQAVARLGSYVLDVPTGRWRSSKVLDEIFGIDATYPHDVDAWTAILHPAEQSEMVRYFQNEVLGRKQRFNREYRIVRPCDGVERWVHGLGDLECDAAGRVVRMLGTIQDITDRKLSEEALRESEERFRLLSEAAFEGIAVIDRGQIVDCNGRLAAMHGYAMAEVIGKPAQDMVAPGSRAVVSEHLRTGALDRHEVLALRKDGSVFPVEVEVRHLIYGGRSLHLIAVRDITERRQADEALRKSEEKFSKVFHSAPAGIAVSGLGDGRLLEINREFARLFGYTRDDVIGRTSFELGLWLDPRDRGQMLRLLATDGEVKDQELRLRAKDGRIMTVRYFAQAIELEGQSLLLSAFVDITRRKQAEEALRRAQEQYQALVEGVRDVIFALTPEGGVEALNPAFEEITGWPRDAWLGKPFAGLLHHEDLPTANALVERVLRGEPRPTAQVRVRTKDGGYRVAEVHTAAEQRDGAIVGILGIARDITDRLTLEEQFRQAQKMEAVGRLAGGVAHDFNNLLTVIRSYSDLLLDGLPADDARRADLEEIREAARRATVLTRQLLAFSRRQVMQPSVMSLNTIVAGAERLLRRLIGEDITLVTRLDAALGAVKADAGQLEQVIMNLAVNARDAMPDGGTLTVETANVPAGTEPPADLLTVMPPGEYVLLRVIDTGAGMDAGTMAHLFEPFFTTKEVGKGTGLGLATVYGVVKQSGGFISVASEPGRGAAFSVYLPRVGESVEASVAERDGPGSSEGKETILLVEDEIAVRAVASQVLRRLGYAVLEAADARSALQFAEEHKGAIALLVTDVVMPGLDGRELADRLRARRPQLKVLFMSGYAYDAALEHGPLKPGLNFLQKPFTPEGLAQKVREVLDGPSAAPTT
jgi:two-component system cell cycle sensor histidine kinase/response regulator CckA